MWCSFSLGRSPTFGQVLWRGLEWAWPHVRGRGFGGFNANEPRDELAEGILFPLLVGVVPSHERILPSGTILRGALEAPACVWTYLTCLW